MCPLILLVPAHKTPARPATSRASDKYKSPGRHHLLRAVIRPHLRRHSEPILAQNLRSCPRRCWSLLLFIPVGNPLCSSPLDAVILERSEGPPHFAFACPLVCPAGNPLSPSAPSTAASFWRSQNLRSCPRRCPFSCLSFPQGIRFRLPLPLPRRHSGIARISVVRFRPCPPSPDSHISHPPNSCQAPVPSSSLINHPLSVTYRNTPVGSQLCPRRYTGNSGK